MSTEGIVNKESYEVDSQRKETELWKFAIFCHNSNHKNDLWLKPIWRLKKKG